MFINRSGGCRLPAERPTDACLSSSPRWPLPPCSPEKPCTCRSYYTPVDDQVIPTGEVRFVEGTPFDFRQEHTIGERIAQIQSPPPGGYDTNMALWGFDGPTAKQRTNDCVVSDTWAFPSCPLPS